MDVEVGVLDVEAGVLDVEVGVLDVGKKISGPLFARAIPSNPTNVIASYDRARSIHMPPTFAMDKHHLFTFLNRTFSERVYHGLYPRERAMYLSQPI